LPESALVIFEPAAIASMSSDLFMIFYLLKVVPLNKA